MDGAPMQRGHAWTATVTVAAALVAGAMAGCGSGATTPSGAATHLAGNVARAITRQVAAVDARAGMGSCHDFNPAACVAAASQHGASYVPLGSCRPEHTHRGYNWACDVRAISAAVPRGAREHYLVKLGSSGCWLAVNAAAPASYDSHVRGCTTAQAGAPE